MKKQEIFLPPHGMIEEIRKITGYSRTTITNALRYGSAGVKAERVRRIYKAKYLKS